MSAVADKVISIVAAIKRVAPETINQETSLEQLGIDSLDKINLLFELESAFNIDIPDEVAGSIKTVGDIVGKLEAIGVQAQPGTAGA
jgi:acyl carrier protein